MSNSLIPKDQLNKADNLWGDVLSLNPSELYELITEVLKYDLKITTLTETPSKWKEGQMNAVRKTPMYNRRIFEYLASANAVDGIKAANSIAMNAEDDFELRKSRTIMQNIKDSWSLLDKNNGAPLFNLNLTQNLPSTNYSPNDID